MTQPDTVTLPRATVDAVREALRMNARAAEMQANIMRDKKRTKAYGQVHEMCLRVANGFDVHAIKLRAALALIDKEKDNG